MAKIVWRQKAIDDLSEIWEYTIQEWSVTQADKYFEIIKLACNEIAGKPGTGKVYTEISNNLLGLRCGKHIIFYHIISEDEIELIRILHENMDLKKRITE